MWTAAQRFLALHDERLCERAAADAHIKHEMDLALQEFRDFLPAAVLEDEIMARKTPNGKELKAAIQTHLENMDVSERKAFDEIWARADRVRSHTHW